MSGAVMSTEGALSTGATISTGAHVVGSDQIAAIVVAVPARDEQDRIARCVLSLLTAIDTLSAERGSRRECHIDVIVAVASDGSTDDTDAILDAIGRLEVSVSVVSGRWGSAGGARRAAVEHGLATITRRSVPSNSIWIATTDADSAVPADWLVRHVDLAHAGHDALAGIVELADDADRTAEVLASFTSTYVIGPTSHPHVHGANLGIRASAYLAAGGFPAVIVAEDHGLWNELRRRQFRMASPTELRVFTSSRISGRAPGGFADTMARQVSAMFGVGAMEMVTR